MPFITRKWVWIIVCVCVCVCVSVCSCVLDKSGQWGWASIVHMGEKYKGTRCLQPPFPQFLCACTCVLWGHCTHVCRVCVCVCVRERATVPWCCALSGVKAVHSTRDTLRSPCTVCCSWQ